MARKPLFNPGDAIALRNEKRYKPFGKPAIGSEARALIGRAIDRGKLVLAPNTEEVDECE